MQNCVFFEILHFLRVCGTSHWQNTGQKQIIIDFIYFKTVIHDFGRILNSPAILY